MYISICIYIYIAEITAIYGAFYVFYISIKGGGRSCVTIYVYIYIYACL